MGPLGDGCGHDRGCNWKVMLGMVEGEKVEVGRQMGGIVHSPPAAVC